MPTLRYLALGDSYTIGEGVAEQDRWPTQLVAQLREQGIAIDSPRIIAQTGWTTDELTAAMDAAEPLGEWDFVTLLIGVNDQYRGYQVETYRAKFSNLLNRVIALAKGRPDNIRVFSIPDWGVTPFGQASGRDAAWIAREIDAYNAASQAICITRNVAWIDITDLTREFGTLPAMLAEDGLHPSAAMYRLWVLRLLEHGPFLRPS